MAKINCKNCDQIVDGNFCTHCGQSIKVDRINLYTFLMELPASIFQINKGLFYSFKELFVRPGHSIKEYLAGKRKNHFKPIGYAFILSTIYFLLSQLAESGTFVNELIVGWTEIATESQAEAGLLATFNWFAKNYAYTILMFLPLYSLASYLAFLRSGLNYLEHFVLNAYIIGQQAIFYSLSSILSLIVGNNDVLTSITLWFSVFYTFFVFWQFFSTQSRVAVILRTILTYLLYVIILSLIISIILLVSQ